jgi:hypothetical protein
MFKTILPLSALILLSACTTITRGSSESYAINTKPSGAMAEVTDSRGTVSCTTPCSVKVKRRGLLQIVISKDGFETLRTTVTSSIDTAGGAGMAGNIILGGFIGAAVDAGTGAMHSHKPNPLEVELVRVDGPAESIEVEPVATEPS